MKKNDKKENKKDEEVLEEEVKVSEKEIRRQYLLNLQAELAREGITSIGDIEIKLRKLEL